MSLNAVSNKSYSDLSGQFCEGLKHEDMQKSANSDSIFIDDNRDSTRVDIKHDDALSQDDVTADLRKDLKKYKGLKYLSAAGAVVSTIGALTAKGNLCIGLNILLAAANTVGVLWSHDQQSEIEKKIAEA